MGTIITWIVVFAILCGCLFLWTYMLHRGPHSDENGESPSCDGDCLNCAKNFNQKIQAMENCDFSEQKS